ncbi:MAG: hypothetical protein OXU45_06200 [Candidatus Melainabacteria bacterium]|nr:hypothetical protein [Candidatus Melainabacteria bacterium]
MPLNDQEMMEANSFLQRLQGQTVKVEIASRINTGFKQSFAVKLEKSGGDYKLTSESGEVSTLINLSEAESLSSGHNAVTLLYGDNLITVLHERIR